MTEESLKSNSEYERQKTLFSIFAPRHKRRASTFFSMSAPVGVNMFMKMFLSIFFVFCFAIPNDTEAGPLTVRCSGQPMWAEQVVAVQIEIALPIEKRQVVSIYTPDRQTWDFPDLTPVGVGAIQIAEQMGDANSSHRHKFIVTRFPDEKSSLAGFYLINSYVNFIRADLWEKDKPFIYLIPIIMKLFKVFANKLYA